MTYNPNEPQLTEGYSTAQPNILENFSQANTVFSVDHGSFAPSADVGGTHTGVRLVEQGSTPTTGTNEMALYCINDATLGVTACFRDENDGSVTCIATNSSLAFGPQAVAAVLFNASGVITGSTLNVTSVTPSGTSPVSYTIAFTSPIPANCSGQVSFNFLNGLNVVPPSVFSVSTTQAVINWIGPLFSATFAEMSVIIWNTP